MFVELCISCFWCHKKRYLHVAALKPAAMEAVGLTVWIPKSVFDELEPVEKRKRGREREGGGREGWKEGEREGETEGIERIGNWE